jgi:hypothetical protein
MEKARLMRAVNLVASESVGESSASKFGNPPSLRVSSGIDGRWLRFRFAVLECLVQRYPA